MKPKSIVVVGSSNTDMIIQLARIPKPGETILGGEFTMAAGGKGANQAVAAARAGGRITFVARVGQDMFGAAAIAGFRRDGINVRHVVRDRRAASGVALIFVAKDGENSIAVASGANFQLSPTDINHASPAISRASVMLTQLETPLATVTAAVKLAARAGVKVILNPAPARPLPASLLKLVSIITPNETEAELLTGIKVNNDRGVMKAAAALRAKGVGAVVITLGARGAYYDTGAEWAFVPGFKVKPVDTTAAGDVFNGALAVALAEGKSMEAAVRFANAAAAISVTRLGAQPSAPKRADIIVRLEAIHLNRSPLSRPSPRIGDKETRREGKGAFQGSGPVPPSQAA
jgi:ribokinase